MNALQSQRRWIVTTALLLLALFGGCAPNRVNETANMPFESIGQPRQGPLRQPEPTLVHETNQHESPPSTSATALNPLPDAESADAESGDREMRDLGEGDLGDWDLDAWSDDIARQMANEDLAYRQQRIAGQLLPELERLEQRLQERVLKLSHPVYVRRRSVIARVRSRWQRELRRIRDQLNQ